MNASVSASHNIDKVSTTHSSHSQAAKQSRASYPRQPRQHTRTKQDDTEMVTDCHLCGGNHEKRKSKYPAWEKTCDGCHGRNHFKVKCRKTEVHAMSTKKNLDDSDASVGREGLCKRVTALMKVNECDVTFRLDSTADVNTICQKCVRKN